MMTIGKPMIMRFYGDNAEDFRNLPTATTEGKGKYENCGCAPVMSIATILTNSGLKIYMLRSTGWVDITNSQIIEAIL